MTKVENVISCTVSKATIPYMPRLQRVTDQLKLYGDSVRSERGDFAII